MKNKLSAIVITFNEEKNIEVCLQSLEFCDEIIIIDSGSTDKTVNIAKKYTQKVYFNKWPGFGPQKNFALSKSTNDWIISLDADEVISDSLKQEIIEAIYNPEFDGYKLPRLSKYCGKFLYHGGWWPDYVTRLFKKSSYGFTNDLIHERVETHGDLLGKLNNHIIHNREDSLDATLNRMNKYSTIWANANKDKKYGSLSKALTHGLWTFIRIYLIRKGFLDGKEGFLMALSNSIGSFYKYLKLYYLQKENNE